MNISNYLLVFTLHLLSQEPRAKRYLINLIEVHGLNIVYESAERPAAEGSGSATKSSPLGTASCTWTAPPAAAAAFGIRAPGLGLSR